MTILIGCAALVKAIDVYLAKADSDLTDALDTAGFVEPKATVQAANELESKIADALVEETVYIKSKLREAVDLYMFASAIWVEAREYDDVDKKLEDVFYIEFSTQIPKLTSEYIKLIDPELTVAAITRRTTDWARSWSVELGRLMKLNTHEELERLLVRGLKNGQNVAEFTRALMDSKIRDEYYKARRVAITETLRAHSVAQQEAITQNPAVEYKEWVHTGSYRNDPRPGHVALGGTVIPKDQRFTLVGGDKDKTIHHPMYPRDTDLPAGESINCHCIHRGIASEEALGLSIEERRRLQQEAIDADDGEWEKELNARNKARAGIKDPSTETEVKNGTESLPAERNDGKMKPMDGVIGSPIESRRPADVVFGGKPLSRKQQSILGALKDGYGARAVVNKKAISMPDLAAMTAATGDEFAMFTQRGKRLIIRGDSERTPLSKVEMLRMAAEGYRWSGHTHPGFTSTDTFASGGDLVALSRFKQRRSVIYNAAGKHRVFPESE